jgi:hypothetical protein
MLSCARPDILTRANQSPAACASNLVEISGSSTRRTENDYYVQSKICAEEVRIMRIRHWQDAASLLLGVWLVLSPFALGFAGAATWITTLLGLFVILFALEGFVIPSYLEEWGEILLGLALLVAPWVVGYEPVLATVNSVISGLVVILFAAWELATDRDFITWWHDRWHRTAN